MTFEFMCNCESKTVIVLLVHAWETWNIHPDTGEILSLSDSGSEKWDNPHCSNCNTKVKMDTE